MYSLHWEDPNEQSVCKNGEWYMIITTIAVVSMPCVEKRRSFVAT